MDTRDKTWLKKTKVVIVRELHKVTTHNCKLVVLNTELSDLMDSQDKRIKTLVKRVNAQYLEIRLKDAHINTLQVQYKITCDYSADIAQGFVHLNTLIEHHFRPKPTLWQRFKDWRNERMEPDLNIVDLRKIL